MKQPEVLILSVMTLVLALAWLGFDAYHAYTRSTIEPALAEIAIPLTPTIDKDLIDALKRRQVTVVTTGSATISPAETVKSGSGSAAPAKSIKI